METRILSTTEEMLAQLELMQQLYPKLTEAQYRAYLTDMLPHNYRQLAVFEDRTCLGLTGYWTGTKLWSGKYIEIDNFIVHSAHRRRGVGKILTAQIESMAREQDCTMIVLDAFTGNFKAHRFYYNEGFSPKGFHFVKILNEQAIT